MRTKDTEENNTRRFALTFTPTNYERLARLARATGKVPAVCARDIIVGYLDDHADDLAELEQAAANYKARLERLNARGTISLFPELEKGQEVM